jgi:hypothetical protein
MNDITTTNAGDDIISSYEIPLTIDDDHLTGHLFEYDIHERLEQAGIRVFEALSAMDADSKLPILCDVKKLCWSDIHMEFRLGEGCYADVWRTRLHHSNNDVDDSTGPLSNTYALKRLRKEIIHHEDPEKFFVAAVDLAMEGHILSRLCHENIIKLHGIVQDVENHNGETSGHCRESSIDCGNQENDHLDYQANLLHTQLCWKWCGIFALALPKRWNTCTKIMLFYEI